MAKNATYHICHGLPASVGLAALSCACQDTLGPFDDVGRVVLVGADARLQSSAHNESWTWDSMSRIRGCRRSL